MLNGVKDKLKKFKNWVFGPSVKKWLANAFGIIKEILGSPTAVNFYIALIAAALGIPEAEVKILWDLIFKLACKAEDTYTSPGSGDLKYKMVFEEFKASGQSISTFAFDYILHNCLAQLRAEKVKGSYKPPV